MPPGRVSCGPPKKASPKKRSQSADGNNRRIRGRPLRLYPPPPTSPRKKDSQRAQFFSWNQKDSPRMSAGAEGNVMYLSPNKTTGSFSKAKTFPPAPRREQEGQEDSKIDDVGTAHIDRIPSPADQFVVPPTSAGSREMGSASSPSGNVSAPSSSSSAVAGGGPRNSGSGGTRTSIPVGGGGTHVRATNSYAACTQNKHSVSLSKSGSKDSRTSLKPPGGLLSASPSASPPSASPSPQDIVIPGNSFISVVDGEMRLVEDPQTVLAHTPRGDGGGPRRSLQMGVPTGRGSRGGPIRSAAYMPTTQARSPLSGPSFQPPARTGKTTNPSGAAAGKVRILILVPHFC